MRRIPIIFAALIGALIHQGCIAGHQATDYRVPPWNESVTIRQHWHDYDKDGHRELGAAYLSEEDANCRIIYSQYKPQDRPKRRIARSIIFLNEQGDPVCEMVADIRDPDHEFDVLVIFDSHGTPIGGFLFDDDGTLSPATIQQLRATAYPVHALRALAVEDE